ncbi:LANO_0E16798g1_1 [Lachancea nothofagi CBS 11611]|uniref:LANO_0E16798g1_1 n=1 Tax=Lachancea nothofagi CBS 11611 TaxID=1266666 RepID=A0A1G4K2A9_9SACH|nr:LANO_0E16798g1_1 [Lachancea nothofagi CBS 11611]
MNTEVKFEAVGVVNFDHWKEAKRFSYVPPALDSNAIELKIEVCGVCGSDIHAAAGHWGKLYTPLAVGHEIVGKITAMGDKVDKTKFHIGDRVGVGAQTDSCGDCRRCSRGLQQSCKDSVLTYMSIDKKNGFKTQGGYASHIRANSGFVFKIPENMDSAIAAPLLCGGITGFRPLMTAGVKEGTRVGIVGVGGIGHMSIQFAKALGAEVTAISRSDRKYEDAKKLGADHYIATAKEGSLDKHEESLDVIVMTTSSFSQNDIEKTLSLLMAGGRLIFITAPPADEKLILTPFTMLLNQYHVGGSCIGSPKDIEYMLKLASEKDIKPWVQRVNISEENVSDVWQKMVDGDVRYRYVFDGYDEYFK